MKKNILVVLGAVVGVVALSAVVLSVMETGGYTLKGRLEVSAGYPPKLYKLRTSWKKSTGSDTVASIIKLPQLKMIENPVDASGTVEVMCESETQKRVKEWSMTIKPYDMGFYNFRFTNIKPGDECVITARFLETSYKKMGRSTIYRTLTAPSK